MTADLRISDGSDICLGEGSLFERLRRNPAVKFNAHVAHATLIYDSSSLQTLRIVRGEYFDIGERYGLNMLSGTSTWRAGLLRCETAGLDVRQVNRDNVDFMRGLIASRTHPISLCGVLGPQGDAYRPEEGLEMEAAAEQHRPQADALAEAGVDQLAALTMPALSEAVGMARALASTGLPYGISFVVRSSGTLLDGTMITEAVDRIDDIANPAPTAYQVNCVHPAVFRQAMTIAGQARPDIAARFNGFQANTSARTPEELDGLAELDAEEPEPFADAVLSVQWEFSITNVGGCCGTTTAHMEAIARRLAKSR